MFEVMHAYNKPFAACANRLQAQLISVSGA